MSCVHLAIHISDNGGDSELGRDKQSSTTTVSQVAAYPHSLSAVSTTQDTRKDITVFRRSSSC